MQSVSIVGTRCEGEPPRHTLEYQGVAPGAQIRLYDCTTPVSRLSYRTMTTGEIHRRTCKRWDDRWEAHFVTFSCFGRQPFFLGRQSPGWFLDSVSAARERGLFELWAYVVMPEHAHLVILPAEGVAIRTILYEVKRPVGMRCIKWVKANSPKFLGRMSHVRGDGKTIHRFWQFGGGYDRNLRSAHDVHEKINYCHDNPVASLSPGRRTGLGPALARGQRG
jgi:putative transposase